MSIYKSPLPDISIPECTLAQLVLEQVKQYGNAVAFVDGMSGKETTYAELEMKIRKVAAGLHARGFKQGDVFAIYLPNCADYIVLFYAVAILGGTLSTVNPLYTAEELAFQLKDVSAKYLITLSMFLDKANEALEKVSTVKECFLLDKLAAEGSWLPYSGLFQAPSDTIPTVTVDAKKDTLVIPYSSGTTGLPKGVELTHYNLVSNILQVAQVEGKLIQGQQTLLAFLPFFHIYGMTLFLGFALYKGFKVVIMPKFDFDKFLELIQTQKVTFVHLAPPVALALAKHPLVDKYNLTSVQHIMSGAAPLSADLEEAVRKRLNVNIRQGYGMTESSPVSHIPFMDTKPGSIGLLLPNMEAKLIDTATAETIEGIKKEGELCMKGPNIMKGYLNRPDATAQTVDKDGFLHTGDVAYVDEDGYFFIVDRVKELIKYKGYQVPPAELEGLLLSHHAVADVAVIPIPDEEAGELPKAYVVTKPGQTLKEEDLHQFLEPKVAFYKKLRGGIEFTDVIPKSPSGKILRRILKQKEKERYDSAKKPQN